MNEAELYPAKTVDCRVVLKGEPSWSLCKFHQFDPVFWVCKRNVCIFGKNSISNKALAVNSLYCLHFLHLMDLPSVFFPLKSISSDNFAMDLSTKLGV